MVWNIFKVVAVVAGVTLPIGSVAAGCVEDVDVVLTVRENGSTYYVERTVDYVTHITAKDLRNSKGTRLANFAAVMQQDRANAHKGITADDVDSYFNTAERRGELSTARYFADCGRSAASVKAFKSDIWNGHWAGGIWVVVFHHPAGGLGVYLSEVD